MVCDKTEGELLSGLHNISSFIDPILPMNYTLIEAAQWPNQLNDGGYWILQNASHFDLPFSPDGITVPIDVQDWDFNLAYALGEFDYDLYKLIKASTSWNDTLTFEASFDLRYVISLFGNLFEPLQNILFVNREYPRGDANGWAFPILVDEEEISLAEFWGSGALLFPNVSVPLNSSMRTQIKKIASYLESYTPISSVNYTSYNFTKLSIDSYVQATQHVYNDLLDLASKNKWAGPVELSSTYVSNAENLVKTNLATAGYHLAYYLKEGLFWRLLQTKAEAE